MSLSVTCGRVQWACAVRVAASLRQAWPLRRRWHRVGVPLRFEFASSSLSLLVLLLFVVVFCFCFGMLTGGSGKCAGRVCTVLCVGPRGQHTGCMFRSSPLLQDPKALCNGAVCGVAGRGACTGCSSRCAWAGWRRRATTNSNKQQFVININIFFFFEMRRRKNGEEVAKGGRGWVMGVGRGVKATGSC